MFTDANRRADLLRRRLSPASGAGFEPCEALEPRQLMANMLAVAECTGPVHSQSEAPAIMERATPVRGAVRAVNHAPRIYGVYFSSGVRDNATVNPFAPYVLADRDRDQALTLTVTLGKPKLGGFTGASLRAAGFVKVAKGSFSLTGQAPALQDALRGLVYDARNINGPLGKVVSANFIITLSDGMYTAVDTSASVVIRNV